MCRSYEWLNIRRKMARCASRVASVSYWIANRKTSEYPNCFGSEVPNKPKTKVLNGDISIGDPSEIKSSIYLDKDSRKFIHGVINRIDGLFAIIVTDREGVPVIKVTTEKLPQSVTRSSFFATVSLAIDQAGKVGIGKNKRIICMFANYQVIHFNRCPLMISLIANSKANTGLLLNLETKLDPLVTHIGAAIEPL